MFEALALDAFDLPEGVTYLDGNSLGPLPKAARARVDSMLKEEWGKLLIGGWNAGGADGEGWMDQPLIQGDRIGHLIGAPKGTTLVGETLSIRLYQALAAALSLRPDRKVVLTDSGNFPSDLYMAQALLETLGQGHELVIVEPEEVADRIGDDVAVLMLTHVDYRSGRMHDMAALTKAAHDIGALTVWDLAHSAGAVVVDLAGCEADFAVGCTYKYLNGGPGAPAFIHAREDHCETARPVLAGWLGHAAPFAFEQAYRPGPGISRFRVGTPPIVQMAALETALDVFDGVEMADIRARSIALSQGFVERVLDKTDLQLASDPDPQKRGSQISLHHAEGYAVMQALIARGVVGDFRAPDILRFGFAPLYNSRADVLSAADELAEIVASEAWNRPEFLTRKAVT
jgi:kynureninase